LDFDDGSIVSSKKVDLDNDLNTPGTNVDIFRFQ
jgi:hypothetical protein